MKAARIIDLTFDGRLSTGRSNISNLCSEGSLQETRVEELNALQLERVCFVSQGRSGEVSRVTILPWIFSRR